MTVEILVGLYVAGVVALAAWIAWKSEGEDDV
jgi:hypothetical protein